MGNEPQTPESPDKHDYRIHFGAILQCVGEVVRNVVPKTRRECEETATIQASAHIAPIPLPTENQKEIFRYFNLKNEETTSAETPAVVNWPITRHVHALAATYRVTSMSIIVTTFSSQVPMNHNHPAHSLNAVSDCCQCTHPCVSTYVTHLSYMVIEAHHSCSLSLMVDWPITRHAYVVAFQHKIACLGS